ncbi:MAG: hypothetical protein HYX32_00735 [Actinobacteria bacterium]|nr:hypothetical protein [Actinomycetota bacterium]
MFDRKDKKAIANFPPHHQALVNEQQLVASLSRNDWHGLLVSLKQHDQLVKKHRLPPRSLDFVLPLLRILLEDVPRDGYLGLRADLRGDDAPGKVGQAQNIPPINRGVKSIEQTYHFDPWLALEAKLANRAKLDLWVADLVRVRKIHKRGSSGKMKTKFKRKSIQKVRVRLSVPASWAVVAPASGVPGWCRITMEREGDRIVLDGRSKYPIVVPDRKHGIFTAASPQVPGAPTQGQLNNVLLLIGEVFRWIPKTQQVAS